MIGFLFSIFGLLALLLGAVGFFLLPILPKITGVFKPLAGVYFWMLARTLKRGAFVVTEQGDVLLKRMTPDDRGVETMSFDDSPKAFEDPDDANHYWHGIRFALADEVHGILFDPRHAAVGARKAMYEQADSMFAPATKGESDAYSGINAWVRGVFELPSNAYEIVDLAAARQLVTGLERADHPDTVETFREYAEAPYKSGTSSIKMLLLLAAILGPFLGLGLLADQLGAPSRSIGFGAALLLFAAPSPDINIDIRRVAVGVATAIVVAVPFAVVALLAAPLTALWLLLTLALGWVLMAVVMLVLGVVVGGIPRLLLKLGLLGYDRPVFTWTPDKYVLREARTLDIDDDREPAWYGVGGAIMGFSYEPGPESLGSAVSDRTDLKSSANADTYDGITNLPRGTARRPEQTRAGYLGGFIPDTIDDTVTYVDTDIVLSSLTNSAVGLKSHRFLVAAKREYGGEGGIQDKTFAYVFGGLSTLSFAAGVGVFFLL